MKKIAQLVLILVGIVSAIGCESTKSAQPSILILAVENLSFDSFSCQTYEGKEHSAFRLLCEEGISFLQSFTPSLSSQATAASILTGLYPYEHGVRHNGSVALPPEIDTLSELAYSKDYRTAFFGGSQTIKHHSRIHQGFQVYEDGGLYLRTLFYRPIEFSLNEFWKWLKSERKSRPFFSFIQISDLLFPKEQTRDDQGDLRGRSFEGQLEEIDESLFTLFAKLKSSKQWKNTVIVFTSPQGGVTEIGRRENPNVNLYSERVHVPLIIKPVQSEKEETPRSWNVDNPVTLVDLGKTMANLLGVKFKVESQQEIIDILNSEPEERVLIQESGWPLFHEKGSVRYSFRKGHWLWINDLQPQIYNGLTDVNEWSQIPAEDNQVQALKATIESAYSGDFPRWSHHHSDSKSYFPVFYELLRKEDWSALVEKNKQWKNQDLTDFVNLMEGKIPLAIKNPCVKDYLLITQNRPKSGKCKNQAANVLFDYLALPQSERGVTYERLFIEFSIHRSAALLMEIDRNQNEELLGGTYSEETINIFDLILFLRKNRRLLLSLEADFAKPKRVN